MIQKKEIVVRGSFKFAIGLETTAYGVATQTIIIKWPNI